MTHINRSRTYMVSTILALTACAAPALAQESIADIRSELTTLRAELQQLREEVAALKAGADVTSTAPPAPNLELLQTQVRELAQVKVESTSRMPIKVFGTVHMNTFANSGGANWLDNPNVVNPAPVDGLDRTFSATLRQTRVGLTMDGPTLGSVRTSAVAAMDFFGGIPGFQTGQVMGLPRLLVAFARFEGERTAVEVGQDHMLLAPRDPTSLAAFSFPALFRSGNLYLRTPQARVERALTPHLRASAGIVAPIGGDLVGEDFRFVPPALGGERSGRPGFQARVAFASAEPDATRLIDVGVSGHYGWERRRGELANSWAAALEFGLRRDRVGVSGEAFIGDNIDAFGGALGVEARAAGGWGELQVFPSERVSINLGAGTDEIRGGQRALAPRRRNRSAYGNVIFSLTPEIKASMEYRWLATTPGVGAERENHHLDWVLAYSF